ncbi:hypothetical protein M422DRAFT_262584 [Sphaerobolus stellatus SS14]|uniref:Uncharacterized protein n=1 Tax=Sphaerobolus stellatus (strain SS14) TaxID=990650 RepID=A0A0C9V0R0_SPHS4|nr:hypothetical protein M422DRAFT_262584 [Sphaerobolus stellatus SS14]
MKQDLDRDESCRKLSKSLETWYKTLRDFMPPVVLEHLVRKDIFPENELLLLPSDYERRFHVALELGGLAEIEYRFRTHATGQQALTRSKTEILRAQHQVDKWAEVYQRAWNKMNKLKGDTAEHDSRKIKKLRSEDLIMLSGWMEDQHNWRSEGEVAVAAAVKKGKGWQPLPWIWKMQLDADINGNEEDGITQVIEGWTTEVIWIEWVQATASLTRFEEELKLLEAESERVARTFKYYEKKWKDRALERVGPTLVAKGAVAYAHRCTKTFQRLARFAEMDYTALLIHKKMRII